MAWGEHLMLACGLLASCIARPSSASHSHNRYQRLKVTVDCGSTFKDISAVQVGNDIAPDEPYVTMVWMKCREGVKLFTKDYSNHNNNIQYIFYATIHTTGIAQPCTFDGPYDVPGTNIQRYSAIVTLQWSDYRRSPFQVTCDLKPFTTPSVPPSGIAPIQSEVRTDSHLFFKYTSTSKNTNDSPGPETQWPTSTSRQTTVSPSWTGPSTTSPDTNETTTATKQTEPPSSSRKRTPPTTATSTTRSSTSSTVIETTSVLRPTELSPRGKEDYILLIVPHCGSSDRQEAWIEIVTELNLQVVGVCKDNIIVPFISKDRIHYSLRVAYNGLKSAAGQCVFDKRKNSKVYNLRIEISRGKVNKYIHTRKRDYQITCTFGDFANKTSLVSRSSWRRVAPKELQSHQGVEASSVITMQVVDILGHQVPHIPLGKKIRLRLTSDGAAGEMGIRPSSCDVVDIATDHRYALLRAGCGDGIIFPRGSGFISNGLESISPYFVSVTLSTESYLTFECNYTLCTTVCSGSSCANERRKRDNVEYRLVDMGRSSQMSSNFHKAVTTKALVKSPPSSLGSPFSSPAMTSQMSTTPKLSNTAACTTVTSTRGGNKPHAKISPLVALASLGFVVVISVVVAVYLIRQRSFRYVEIHSKV